MNDYNRDSSQMPTAMLTFMCGAIVGAGVALLLAPAPGHEVRRRIGRTARRLGDRARETMSQGRDTLNDIKEDAKSAISSGREAFSRGMESQTPPPSR